MHLLWLKAYCHRDEPDRIQCRDSRGRLMVLAENQQWPFPSGRATSNWNGSYEIKARIICRKSSWILNRSEMWSCVLRGQRGPGFQEWSCPRDELYADKFSLSLSLSLSLSPTSWWAAPFCDYLSLALTKNQRLHVHPLSLTVPWNKGRVVLKPTPYWTFPDVTRTYHLCIRPWKKKILGTVF